MLAKAVFDNIGETSEELSFQRGDVLTIIQIDPNGLEGWWLCSLNDQVGIAPGNRLKQVTGMKDHDKLVKSIKNDQEDVARNNVINTNRKSLEQESKVKTPKRIGSVFLYDQPNPSQPLPMEDYDVPRPGSNPMQGNQAVKKLHGYDLYDSPKSNSVKVKTIEDMYDTPSIRHKALGIAMDHLTIQDNLPGSNRSSGISVLSGISGTSNQSIHSDYTPYSGHSSFDATHDVYDIPPPPRHLMQKSKSSDNVLDMAESYDTPQKQLRHVKSDVKKALPPIETWGGDYCEIHENDDVRTSPDSGVGFCKQTEHFYEEAPKSKQHIIDDDLPVYDSPKTALTKSDDFVSTAGRVHGYQTRTCRDMGGVYDVPPQVTKDSTVLSTITQFNRLSTGSNDSKETGDFPIVEYDELALEMNAAIELLATLQQDLLKAVSRLLVFVSSTWRKRDNLESKLFDVKISCLAIRTALQEYVEFGQGALANSAKLDDKKVYKNLKEYLKPLQDASEKVKKSKKVLDNMKWDINKIATDLVDSTIIDDDLNKIVSVCKECTDSSKHLGSFIQGNARLLFHSNELMPEPLVKMHEAKRDIVINESDNVRHRPPPPVKPKPKSIVGTVPGKPEEVITHFQERPLPTPPLQRKDIHTTPHNKPVTHLPKHSTPERDTSRSVDKSEMMPTIQSSQVTPASPIQVYGAQDYDIPITQQEIEDLQQMKKRLLVTPPDNNNSSGDLTDYDNAQTKINYNDLQGLQDYENGAAEEEYDYVALTPDQVKKSLAFKYFEEGSISKVLTKPSDMYDSPNSIGRTSADQTINSSDESVKFPRMYDSPSDRSVDLYDSPQNNSLVSMRDKFSSSRTSFDLDMSGQADRMQVPIVRTSGLSSKFKEKIEKLQQEAETGVVSHSELGLQHNVNLQDQRKSQVSQMDKQILSFYAGQVESHITVLIHAMEALFQAVDYNQPPKVFIAHSKFVILAAHKLVYIGDTISRNLISEDVRNGIMIYANQLCDTLKSTVTATKRAALEYPSIHATQEMVDRALDINTAATGLKTVIAYNAVI